MIDKTADVPLVFRQRITEIASTFGCIALKIGNASFQANRGSKEYGRWLLEELIRPLAARAEVAIATCQKQEVDASPLLQEILERKGRRYEVKLPEALELGYLGFWAGNIFDRDITTALLFSIDEFLTLPLFPYTSDPFVMQNLRTFAGSAGVRLVSDMLESKPSGVVVSFIGGANDIFIFSSNENLRKIVPEIFKRCRFSPQYLNYASGSFVPLEDVLGSLRPIIRTKSHER